MANPNSFDYPNKGPFGACLDQQLKATFDQNVAFSDSAWENAKQNCRYGCVLPPGIPVWPPGVTPLSAPATVSCVDPQKMTDVQLVNTLQKKPYQFDSPFVVKREYARFVPNDSPAVVRSLENRCGVPAAIAARAGQCAINNALGAATSPTASMMEQSQAAAAAQSPPPTNIVTKFFRSMIEAVRGMTYDAKNWAQLPGDTVGQKLSFMLTHDQDRVVVLVLALLLLFAVIAFIVLMSLAGCHACD